MNVTSKIGNFQLIILVEAHHVQAKQLVRNTEIGIWPLQFGEFFSGPGSCLQMLDEIPSDILSLEARRNRCWVSGLWMLENRTKNI
jgi:hypothetical protein